MHGGFRVDDEQTAAAPGAGGQNVAERVLALQAERARQQREEDEDIAEHRAHEAQFMTVGEFGQEIVRRYRLPHSEAWLLAYQTLKAHRELELFCRWEESFRWSPLPPCPVRPTCWLTDRNRRYYGEKFGLMGPTYLRLVESRNWCIVSSDPLASTLGQGNGTGWWSTDSLAIRRAFAERLLGGPAPAADLEPTAPPAPAVVQSEPAAAPEQPAEPVWKIGRRWTKEAKDKMREQRADGWDDGRIAEHWNFKRQNVARLIGSQSANKATANTPKR